MTQQPRLNFRYRHQGVNYQFSVSAPYTEGHQLTLAEAQALNQLRLENIRENCRPRFVGEAQQFESGALLTEGVLFQLQEFIDNYDSEYQFTVQQQPPERLGAVEREARLIAAARLPEDVSEAEIIALAESIDLVAEARQRVEIRNKITSVAMEELLK